ncbi:MAG TPA: hypothetical protein VG722_04905 [Tepidisphaeraceae bacterium]|nr:hypothetical protein [Tepidisphaeraceae bacterium]
MRRLATSFVVGFVAAVTSAATPTTSNVPPLLPHRPANFMERYQLLIQRNIFDSNRQAYSYHPTTSVETVQVQNTFTLTGLVLENGAYSAFIEDSRTQTTSKYKIGDSVSGGKITAAGIDHIELNTGGKTIRVDLGQTLAGTTPAVAAPTTAPSPGNDIIERLKERRMLELHGG